MVLLLMPLLPYSELFGSLRFGLFPVAKKRNERDAGRLRFGQQAVRDGLREVAGDDESLAENVGGKRPRARRAAGLDDGSGRLLRRRRRDRRRRARSGDSDRVCNRRILGPQRRQISTAPGAKRLTVSDGQSTGGTMFLSRHILLFSLGGPVEERCRCYTNEISITIRPLGAFLAGTA